MGKTPVNYGEPGSATSAAPTPGATTVTAGSGSCGPREGGSSSASAAPTTGAAPRSGIAAVPSSRAENVPATRAPAHPGSDPRKLAVAAAHSTVVAGNDAAAATGAAAGGDDERANAIGHGSGLAAPAAAAAVAQGADPTIAAAIRSRICPAATGAARLDT